MYGKKRVLNQMIKQATSGERGRWRGERCKEKGGQEVKEGRRRGGDKEKVLATGCSGGCDADG